MDAGIIFSLNKYDNMVYLHTNTHTCQPHSLYICDKRERERTKKKKANKQITQGITFQINFFSSLK